MRSYVFDLQDEGGSAIKILLADGQKRIVRDSLQPYFYLVPEGGVKKTAAEIEKRFPEVKEAKVVTRRLGRKDTEVIQIFTHEPKQIPKIREDIKEYGEPHEDDIHHTWRYLIDKDIYPMRYYDFDIKDDRIKSFAPHGEETPKLKICAFDIETYNKEGLSQAEKDPVLLVGYCDEKEKKVFSWKDGYANEKAMLHAFAEKIKKEDADIVVGYNCLPYEENIILADGKRTPIGEYVKKYIEQDKFPAVLGIVNGKVRTVKVKKLWAYDHQQPHEVLRITTRTGRELCVTPGNELLVGTVQGPLWLRADELQPGMLLATPRVLRVTPNELSFIDFIRDNRLISDDDFINHLKRRLRVKFGSYQKAAKKIDMNPNTLKSTRRLSINIVKKMLDLLSEDWFEWKAKIKEIERNGLPVIDCALMYCCGLIATDGNITANEKHNRIYLGNTDIRLINKFTQIIEKKFGRVSRQWVRAKKIQHADRIHARVSSPVFKDFLNGIGIPSGNKTRYGIEYTKLLSFPEELIGAFVAGLIDGDGGLDCGKRATFVINCLNKRSKKELQILLLRLGINAALHSKGLYFLRCQGNVTAAKRWILPFILKHKKKDLFLNNQQSGWRGSIDVLPHSFGTDLNEIRKKHKISSYSFENTPHSTLYYYENSITKKINRDKAWEIIDELCQKNVTVKKLESYFEEEIFWDEAAKIEEDVVPAVYDLTTTSGNFISNGVLTHNSGGFDFPYLSKRFRKLGMTLDLGWDGSEVEIRRGWLGMKADIFGRIHLDAYDGVEFLTGIGAMRLPKNDLPSVYREFFGKEKIDIEARDIWKYWEEGGEKLKLLEEYNKQDAMAAYEIGKEMLPLVIELSRIVGLPAYEISRMSAAQMVEQLLVREAHRQGVLTPKRVGEELVRERLMNPIKGAFVKLPTSGLHENIVVCDFKSLYPSIIISHNIGIDTLGCDCCKNDGNVAPEVNHRFCKKKKGLLPKILGELIDARTSAKAELKKHDKKSNEYRALHFKQWGLKIIANAAYGYQGYARARWYSREAAESTTAWARHYIHMTIDQAEKAGFEVLYADTDSCFLKLGDKKVEEAKAFVDKINASLPERMELEFQGFYPRGVFVTRRMGGAAKKKYALIREDGTVEIKGFEFVRRDWANIAKVAQERVIQAVLKEGKPEKAVEIAKQVISDVRNKKVKFDDVVIYTQVVRKVSTYEQQAPHVKAAKKLIEAGYKVSPGMILEYVVIPGKGSISDRSIPVQLLKKKDYDADYYINNQVLPAVMKILKELGVEEENLKFGGEQAGLKKWF
jgi:DNA polymerase I